MRGASVKITMLDALRLSWRISSMAGKVVCRCVTR